MEAGDEGRIQMLIGWFGDQGPLRRSQYDKNNLNNNNKKLKNSGSLEDSELEGKKRVCIIKVVSGENQSLTSLAFLFVM